MAKYYIKQPFDYITRRDLVKLPDWLWRLYMELRILAGKYEHGGLLESVADCAWELRRDPEQVVEGLQALAEVRLTELLPEGWLLVGFSEEQDAATSTERVQEFRLRKMGETKGKPHGNEDETNRFKNETQLKIESESDLKELNTIITSSPKQLETGAEYFDETQIPKLEPDQREFLVRVMAIFAPKRFKYFKSIKKLLDLRQRYADHDLIDALEWAAGKEMVPGEAVGAVAKAMPGWNITREQVKTGAKGNGNGHHAAPAANPLAEELARRRQQNGIQ